MSECNTDIRRRCNIGGYINQAEIELIETMYANGVRVNEISRQLKRSPSSISRVLSGERGTFWRSHKVKARRCSGCGGMIRAKVCKVCVTRQMVKRKKELDSVPVWCEMINRKTKAVHECRERIRSNERRTISPPKYDPETGIGQF